MELRTWAVVVLMAASCERSVERSVSPSPPVATGDAAGSSSTASVAPSDVRVPVVPRSGTAKDDFPHLQRELSWLARAQDCVPPEDDLLSLALDSYGGKLVLCAQALTRRDISVFFDDVSYACWNVDPATAAVTRRADLGRSYFRCQDGTCPMLTFNKAISYDGTKQVVLAEGKPELSIFARPAGTLIRSFASLPAFAGQELQRGELTLVGDTIFGIVDQTIHVLDDRGGVRGKLEGIELHVVDDGHVLAIRDEQHATLYELATRKSTPISLTAPYLAGAVRHGGTFFAVDDDTRKLVTLDPKTLQPRRSLSLPICKWRPPTKSDDAADSAHDER
jgi:hypothetical protein